MRRRPILGYNFGFIRRSLGGFTIVEVLVVLAVSGAIFLAAALLIGGSQNKAEFTQAIQDAQSQIQQVIGDVANGYYPNTDNFSCSYSSGGFSITDNPTNNQLGTNYGCVFIGKAMLFSNYSSTSSAYVYTIVSNQETSGGEPVRSLSDATATVLQYTNSPSNTLPGEATDYLEYGLTVVAMCTSTPCSSATDSTINSVIFASTPVGAIPSGTGGNQQVEVVPVTTPANTGLSQTESAGAISINNYLNNLPGDYTGTVYLCLASGGTNQSGLITIAGNGQQASVNLKVMSNRDCSSS